MDEAVDGMLSVPPYTSLVSGLQRTRSTDLDRYVRAEFGDHGSAWLADGIRSNHEDSESRGSDNDGRLLRRLTQAIASFF